MIARLSVFLLSAVVLAGCVTTGSSSDKPTSLLLPDLGKTFSSTINVAGKAIPLPKGQFTLAGRSIKMTQKGGYSIAMFLIHQENGKVANAVEIYTNLPLNKVDGPVSAGWSTHRSCLRDDMHHRASIVNERLGDQDCWWVNHWRMMRAGSGSVEHWQETLDFLKTNDLKAPIEMIGVSYRVADKTDYVTLNYYFSPHQQGFDFGADDQWQPVTWSDSTWHPENVEQAPRKKQYINSIVQWGDQWHSKISRILVK